MTKKLTVSVRTHFKIEDIENLIYSMATGSHYWCSNAAEFGYERNVKKITEKGFDHIVFDDEANKGEQKNFFLNMTRIKTGLTLMAKNESEHFADILNENADEITADILLQLALFGEVKYS